MLGQPSTCLPSFWPRSKHQSGDWPGQRGGPRGKRWLTEASTAIAHPSTLGYAFPTPHKATVQRMPWTRSPEVGSSSFLDGWLTWESVSVRIQTLPTTRAIHHNPILVSPPKSNTLECLVYFQIPRMGTQWLVSTCGWWQSEAKRKEVNKGRHDKIKCRICREERWVGRVRMGCELSLLLFL